MAISNSEARSVANKLIKEHGVRTANRVVALLKRAGVGPGSLRRIHKVLRAELQ
jgi:hypothetical protein